MKHRGLAVAAVLTAFMIAACTALTTTPSVDDVGRARMDGGVNGLGGGVTGDGTASGQGSTAPTDSTGRSGVNGLGGG
jgi:hypothetical protein